MAINSKINRDVNSAKMHFGPNNEIRTSNGGELGCGEVQSRVNFGFSAQFDLKGQGQSPHKTIGILT